MKTTQDSTKAIGTDKISSLIFKYSMPAIIGMIVNAVYNIVDRFFVGFGIDPLAIAGISVVLPPMLALMAASILVGVGANALFAIRLGQGRRGEVEHIMGNALVLLFAIPAIVIIVCLIFMDEILLDILSVSPDIFPYAKTYFQIYMAYGIFGAVGPGINHFIRSDGHPKTSMFTQILGAAVNIVLDPIFIFVFDLGIAGAAYATVISQFISFVWVFFYFNSKMTALRFRLKFMRLNLRLCSKILAIGFAPGAMQFAIALVNAALNKSLAFYGGDLAVTSMGIAFSVLIIVFMPLQGLTQGVQPIIGYNYGAKKYDRAIRTFFLAALYATIFVCAAFVIAHAFPNLIIGAFYNKPGALFDLSVRTLKITTLLFPLIGAQIVAANFFQAIDKPVQGAILGLSRQILVFIPLLIILPKFLGLDGVFITFPVSDLICAVLTAVVTFREIRKLRAENLSIFPK